MGTLTTPIQRSRPKPATLLIMFTVFMLLWSIARSVITEPPLLETAMTSGSCLMLGILRTVTALVKPTLVSICMVVTQIASTTIGIRG